MPKRGRVHGAAAVMGAALLMLGGATPLAARPETGDGVVRFVYTGPAASAVFVVGDFNGWSPVATPLDRRDDGTWVAEVFIDPGMYEYKLLVDGQWVADPDNPEVSASGNSVVRVGAGGRVLPPGVTGSGGSGAATSDSSRAAPRGDLRWFVRYLGFVTSRRDRTRDLYDLDRPLHDVDVRLETDFGNEVNGWFLLNFNNLEEGGDLSRTSARYDRGQVLWKPSSFEMRLFDNVEVRDFDDPGHLLGNVGIYADPFGFRRRGVAIRRRILGAPLDVIYADDTEPAAFAPPAAAATQFDLGTGAVFGKQSRYVAARSDRNADVLALRFRGGTRADGFGIGYRSDRGAAPGSLAEIGVEADSLGPRGRGRSFTTHEDWSAWGVDLRKQVGPVQLEAEYLWGTRNAVASQVHDLLEVRSAGAGSTRVVAAGPPRASDTSFELDDSRRVILTASPAGGAPGPWRPALRYAYQEHDFTALVTGTPFLARQHSLRLEAAGPLGPVNLALDLEQDWFEYPAGSSWQTQLWFREHDFWLDETVAGLDRLTLLGSDRAARLRVAADGAVWPARGLQGAVRFTWAAPGMDRPPRYLETIVRLRLPLKDAFELRTHSRLATYRRFRSTAPEVLAALGSGSHLEAGELAARFTADAAHDYSSFAAHFVEIVYEITSRSDVALGFGVDPFVVYEVRNEYMDIGWEQFLFDQGVAPADVFAAPVTLPALLENAERRLERERRIVLEARVRF